MARKLAIVESKYGKSDFERKHQALFSMMCIYGIELLEDNIQECKAHLLEIYAKFLGIEKNFSLP